MSDTYIPPNVFPDPRDPDIVMDDITDNNILVNNNMAADASQTSTHANEAGQAVDGEINALWPPTSCMTDNALQSVAQASEGAHDTSTIASPNLNIETGQHAGAASVNNSSEARDDAAAKGSLNDDALKHRVAQTPASAAEVPSLDLVSSIKGMYRILDLISEQGSGGLVDKVIISQESLGRFINDLHPGAYVSMTRVDFAALDQLSVKPIGIYGSKTELVRFLQTAGVVDEVTALSLCTAKVDGTSPTLRSGLYALRLPGDAENAQVIYVIYWPEDTTWDISAISSVRRNRVTFMRYLTKVADQVVALVSKEDAMKVVWKEETEDDPIDLDDDDSDRMFTFEVAKTHDQEENVVERPGFSIQIPSTSQTHLSEGFPVDATLLKPRLIAGEVKQGLLEVTYIPAETKRQIIAEHWYPARLRGVIENESFRLNKDMSTDAIEILLGHGLEKRAQEACRAYRQERRAAEQRANASSQEQGAQMRAKLDANDQILEDALRQILTDCFVDEYPDLEQIISDNNMVDPNSKSHLEGLLCLHPEISEILDKVKAPNLYMNKSATFKTLKNRILLIDNILDQYRDVPLDKREEFITAILDTGYTRSMASQPKGVTQRVVHLFTRLFSSSDQHLADANEAASLVDDVEFFACLSDIVKREPLLADSALRARKLAHENFTRIRSKEMKKLKAHIRSIQEDECKKQIKREVESQQMQDILNARVNLLETLEDNLTLPGGNRDIFFIESLEKKSTVYSFSETFHVTGQRETHTEPALRYTILPIDLTEGDKHQLQLDGLFVPTPRIHSNSASHFELPVDYVILHIQLLSGGKCLLIIDDKNGGIKVMLESLTTMNSALSRSGSAAKKTLRREKIGKNCLLAFDEEKRMLAVLSTSKVERRLDLHIFVFDETFVSLQALGSPVNLGLWYDETPTILHMVFACGSEELVLINDNAQARIFSFVTQQFRPASLQLQQIPDKVFSTPDGSCFLVVNCGEGHPCMRAYHWSTFGSTQGILIPLTKAEDDNFAISSLVKRTNVHLIGLDTSARRCHSIALGITRKATEFTFKEKGKNTLHGSGDKKIAHNCFIDCHAEVWTRFPVVPAVRRQTITSSANRSPRSIIFVTDRDHAAYPTYFIDLILSFERTTRKPTASELSSTVVEAKQYEVFVLNPLQDISTFCAGEWLVDLLCLIPLHIAITRDNRFVPLKDGVYSAELERSLLGADVARIIDNLSFGWYESLFASYMAKKPVKVVSSMGEQSVGKSFALNHLVDTSFAGSAMRTTEGVWMSVAPLEDVIIVALDFEGVHSIERSAQEDTLLILFNTAISNLVLFRNNFALSRDITGLFRSFQSSSSILDPTTNPDLFQSTLVIIIKDVVESDKSEIVKEFSLKFQQIVQLEQGSNFISRLHRGRLMIVPWPVIESRQFYTLFNTLKKSLDKQETTHSGGSIFLQTLKTLMAKLKANDWGALSQNLAAHRAQLLLGLLPNAFAFGATEIDPEIEPLKDFDSDMIVAKPDTQSRFFLSQLGPTEHFVDRDAALADLISSWPHLKSRFDGPEQAWTQELEAFLSGLVQQRIELVEEWLSLNTARFPATHADIQALRRSANNMIIDMKGCVQLCTLQCASCHLSCILVRHHDGQHDCQTTHKCAHACEFDDHDTSEPCGLPAGHTGKHVCDITAHLCGKPCTLEDKRGCLKECTKVIGHQDPEHMCSATVHECGEPCSLSGIRLPSGQRYSCPEACRRASHEPHDCHVCENRQCPLQCQLCKRLCISRDHLHALQAGAVHLCGQEHSCSALCAAEGICQIEHAPQSVEATFTGRHETFQYTKYTQVSKRLPCIIPIIAGQLDHADVGPHRHDLEQNSFHYCETRCESCGYFCTLERGHVQQEHDTLHGSMSKTQWAIDGPDGTALELDGRKFGSNDEGAPMLCSMVCSSMGRHVHVDYCRTDPTDACGGPEHEHIKVQIDPHPERPKDLVSHSLHWRRTGFKDPYPHEDQLNFALCDAMCSGPEHSATAGVAARPSYCTLPILHPRQTLDQPAPGGGMGYISNDGHAFHCRNPAVIQQAFHVIFVIDRSGSMGGSDRRPLGNTPSTNLITRRHNHRLGAVYSSLDAFWLARQIVTNVGGHGAPIRRDAYTVILFDHNISPSVVHDFSSTPNQLLNAVLQFNSGGGTNFTAAIQAAQSHMEQYWSNERSPVVIFLSDGECSIADETMQNLCLRSIALGKPLSFHAVSFGPRSAVLQRMAHIAIDVQNRAPPDPLHPVPMSSYAEALDSVRLAETFLGIAESLRKPRGSLLHA
ncbi:hypothetical protein AcW2_006594 [Taiwanofungus camphoratus]|nr:hypothetical protein AcW2_006594 [Antrodia cinnamomea]